MNTFVRICCVGLILLLWAAQTFAQPDSAWSKSYGGLGNDDCHKVVATSDGGFALAGTTTSFGSGIQDIWLLKANANGDSMWSRTFGGTSDDQGKVVLETLDNGLLVGGGTSSSGSGGMDMMIVKTDSDGNTEWSQVIGGTGSDICYSAVQTTDSGYAVAGVLSPTGMSSNFGLVKLSASGAILWSRSFGGAGIEICNSIQQTSDGGYILGGFTNSFGLGNFDYWLLKTDANGDSMWSRTLGTPLSDTGTSVVQSSDGGYVIAGYANSGGALGIQFLVFKTNSSGTSQWARGFGGTMTDRCNSIQQSQDGGYFLIGTYNNDFGLLKIASNGDSLWLSTVRGSNADEAFGLAETVDGGLALAGVTNSFGAGATDMWLAKLQLCTNMAPLAPELVVIPEGNNIRLSWNPISESVEGCYLNVTGYLLWYSPTTEGPYYFLDYTTDTTHVHTGVVAFSTGMHYYAETYVGDPIALQSLPHNPVSRFTREQIQQMLNH